jgi:hypothetical protein
MEHGSVVPLNVGSKTTQLDIEAVFQVDASAAVEGAMEANMEYECSTSGGAGPAGLVWAARVG